MILKAPDKLLLKISKARSRIADIDGVIKCEISEYWRIRKHANNLNVTVIIMIAANPKETAGAVERILNECKLQQYCI